MSGPQQPEYVQQDPMIGGVGLVAGQSSTVYAIKTFLVNQEGQLREGSGHFHQRPRSGHDSF
jgi:hypothetical protein